MNKTLKVVSNNRLINDWNYAKNNALGILPAEYSTGSGKKVWWVCRKGHEWEASINSRNRGRGCPYCANRRVLKGFNDFESLYPEIAKEWNYSKNKGLLPSEVTSGSSKIVWWICQYGHDYKS